MKRTSSIAAAFLIVAVAAVYVLFFRTDPLSARAEAIVQMCAGAPERSACYESQIPILYPALSVTQIFDLVRMIRKDDVSYQFCHVLAHKIGERVVAENPDKWVDAIPWNPADGLCSNGYIHGVIGGRFRAEVLNDATIEKLLPDFTRACASRANWNPSDLDRAICYHGMGHLFDFITNADIRTALNLCREVASENFQRVCIQGVFMQIYQPLEPDDYQLIKQMKNKPATSTVRTYCAQFSDSLEHGSCLEESWPFFKDGIFNGRGVASFCSGQPNATETDQCYMSVSSIIGRTSLGNSGRTVSACNNFPDNRKATCFSFSAEAVLEEDRTDAESAIALCNRAAPDIARTCILDLIDHARFVFGGDVMAYNHFCAALPAAYTSSCSEHSSQQ